MPGVIGAGACAVCGHLGEFVVTGAATLESHECGSCRASLRYRVQAGAVAVATGHPGTPMSALVKLDAVRALSLYEPGIIGPFRSFLSGLPNYVNSYFWPDRDPGEERDGVRCEDLRDLTFRDASFDLVISSDIFEHVREPLLGFAEIHRVMRPGGHHVFTVPISWPLPGTTTARVETSGAEDEFLMPAVYHGSPVDPKGSLVYTDFGMDLPEQLRDLGFETVAHHGYRNAITFVSTRSA